MPACLLVKGGLVSNNRVPALPVLPRGRHGVMGQSTFVNPSNQRLRETEGRGEGRDVSN